MNKLEIFFNENTNASLYNSGVKDMGLFIHIYNNFELLNYIIAIALLISMLLIIGSQIIASFTKKKMTYMVYAGIILSCLNIPLIIYVHLNNEKVYYELTYNPATAITGVNGSTDVVELFYPIEDEKLDGKVQLKYLKKEDFKDISLKQENDYCEMTLVSKDKEDLVFNLKERNVFEDCK